MAFTLILELQELNRMAALEEGFDLSSLRASTFFKKIMAKDSKVAKALESLWSQPELLDFIKKVQQGVKRGLDEWDRIDQEALDDLAKLGDLHTRLFPEESKKAKFYHDPYSPSLKHNAYNKVGSNAHR